MQEDQPYASDGHQEISAFLDLDHVCKSQPLKCIWTQVNPINTLTPYKFSGFRSGFFQMKVTTLNKFIHLEAADTIFVQNIEQSE